MFLGGLAAVVIATQSGIGAYDDVLFWDHMVQHLMLIMVAPPLLVAGQPVTLLLHASRNPLHTWSKKVLRSTVLAAITWPVFGVVLYVGVIVGTSPFQGVPANVSYRNYISGPGRPKPPRNQTVGLSC